MGRDSLHDGWKLERGYTIPDVVERCIDLVWGELFSAEFASQPPPSPLGLAVAGYSEGDRGGQAWSFTVEDAQTRPVPELVADQDSFGWRTFAQTEATDRLFAGWDSNLFDVLSKHGLTSTEMAKVVAALQSGDLLRQPAIPAMPFADAIGLARFMVELTEGYSRYLLGPDSVGGPIEIAGITRYEGFKWVSRKHYYDARLNPREPHEEFF